MENASKALLIAGAIIVVLVIIAVGMMILNSGNGIFKQATLKMSDQEKTMFNNTYTMYVGRISGSQVKSLLQEVITNNNNGDYIVTVNGSEPADTTSVAGATIVTAKQYDVAIGSYEDGLVKNITIAVH